MKTRIKIMCNGEWINKHSDGRGYGWTNPIDLILPIGSIINYKTLKGIEDKYKIIGYEYSTVEDFSSSYKNQICIIQVEKIVTFGEVLDAIEKYEVK